MVLPDLAGVGLGAVPPRPWLTLDHPHQPPMLANAGLLTVANRRANKPARVIAAIRAGYAEGLLTVTLPKARGDESKPIRVSIG